MLFVNKLVTSEWILSAWFGAQGEDMLSEFFTILSLVRRWESKVITQETRVSPWVAQLVKESACNGGDLSSIPGLGRSPGKGKSYPLQYSDLENCIVHGVAKSWTRLSNFHSLTHYIQRKGPE